MPRRGRQLIATTCSTYHKFVGTGESRFNLKAPDLMWGGSTYQRDWLIRWLTEKEPMLSVKGNRWDQSQDIHKHTTMTEKQANAIADSFKNISKIRHIADGVMIARGDLVIELSPEQVQFLQKRIIAQAHQRGKPVITTTQMLESMTRHPSLTRAEPSDVANAVLDSTDAVMLSAETSTGSYPVKAVEVMDRIIRQTEKEGLTPRHMLDSATPTLLSTPEAICEGAVSLSRLVGAQAIVVFTEAGHTVLLLAPHRPAVPILALTPSPAVTRQLALVWGLASFVFSQIDDTDEQIHAAQDRLKKLGMIVEGQLHRRRDRKTTGACARDQFNQSPFGHVNADEERWNAAI